MSQNAVKHGLFASETVINGEDQAQFDLHRDAFLAEMAPVGVMGSMLAARIVSLSWRLNRAERMQNQAIDEIMEDLKPTRLQVCARQTVPKFLREPEKPVPEPAMALGRVAKRDYANNRVLDRLMMYERRIESSMLKIMRELRGLQLIRKVEEAAAEQSVGQTFPAQCNEGDLKKQSQSAPDRMGTSSFVKEDYGKKRHPGDRRNKANIEAIL